MYTSFQLAKKYISYYLSASNSKGHGIHSPFVFNFILDVLNNRQNYLPPSNIESVRKELQNNTQALTIKDLRCRFTKEQIRKTNSCPTGYYSCQTKEIWPLVSPAGEKVSTPNDHRTRHFIRYYHLPTSPPPLRIKHHNHRGK
jgi:hypothetical protein